MKGWLAEAASKTGILSALFAAGALVGCEPKEKAGAEPPKEELVAGKVEDDDAGKGAPDPAEVVEAERAPAPSPTPAKPAEVEEEPDPAPEVVEEPSVPKEPWTVDHAGFAARLPGHTDFYGDVRKLDGIWAWLEESGALEQAKTFLGGALDQAEGPEELKKMATEGMRVLPDLFAEEGFVATRGLAWTWEAAMGSYVAVYRSMGAAMASALASGDPGGFFMEDTMSTEMMGGFVKWIREKLDEEDGFPKIAMYGGGRVREEGKRADLLKWFGALAEQAVEADEAVKATEFTKNGVAWSGFELRLGAIEGFFEEAPEDFDAELWKSIEEEIGEWRIVVVCAEVDDFVVVALGNGEESIELAEAEESSLAKSETFEFMEQHDAKAVASTYYASKRLVAALQEGVSYLPFFEGAQQGLKDSPLGRGAAMVKALGALNQHWQARREGVAHDWVGTVLMGEEIRVESKGGWLGAGLDLEAPLKFAGAFAGLEKEPFMRGHWKMREEHVAHGHGMVESGLLFVKLVAEELMDGFADGAEEEEPDEAMKYQRWKRDLSRGLDAIIAGYRDHFAKAFGEETAFVMDLEGAMVPAVGVDEELLKKGRIPRAALVRPVVKREALSQSWDIWQSALTSIFGVMAESLEQPIPFPDTMSAEKDDLKTYFFPFPFASDDFLPSVSVSDELFILGSSKTLSEMLYEASRDSKGEGKEAGFWLDVDGDKLWEFCSVWLEFYEKQRANADEIEEDDLRKERKDELRLNRAFENLEPDQLEQASQLLTDLILEEKSLLDALLEIEALEKQGEVDFARNLLEAVDAQEDPEPGSEAASKMEELRESLGATEEELPEEEPGEPTELETEEEPGEIREPAENPLLKELSGDEEPNAEVGDENPLLKELAAEEKGDAAVEREIEELLAEEDLKADFEELEMAGPFGGLFDAPDPGMLRDWLDKLRAFRAFRYHRRLEDGMPRSSLRVRLSIP